MRRLCEQITWQRSIEELVEFLADCRVQGITNDVSGLVTIRIRSWAAYLAGSVALKKDRCLLRALSDNDGDRAGAVPQRTKSWPVSEAPGEVESLLFMCGRFNLTDPEEIVRRFGFMDWSEKRVEPRFNIAPSQEILTIVQLPLQGPEAQTAVWGLKPFWQQKSPGKPPPINARAEALGSSAMFRDTLRCLVPATGFYEWRNRQPFHIRLRGGGLFTFAGLWLPAGRSGGLPSVAIVTTRPNALMADIHTRMPAILRLEDELRWLDPGLDLAEARKLAAEPLPAELMEAYAVKPLVNSWENEGPQLVEPLPPEAAGPAQLTLGL